MSECSSMTHQSSPATRPLDHRGRLAAVSLALSLIAFALHVAFCTESPLINSALRNSIATWILAVPMRYRAFSLVCLPLRLSNCFPRLQDKWTTPIALALWFGLIIRLATCAVPEQSSSTYSPAQKAAVGPQPGGALTQSLETKLKQAASAADSVTPIKVSSTTDIFKVLSNQNTLIYYIRDLNLVLPELEKSKVDTFIKKLKPSIQKLVAKEACTNKVNPFLLNEGVIIRYEMHDKQKIKYMEISVNKSDCR